MTTQQKRVGRKIVGDARYTHLSAAMQIVVAIGLLGGKATTSDIVKALNLTTSQCNKAVKKAMSLGWVDRNCTYTYTGGRCPFVYFVTDQGCKDFIEFRRVITTVISNFDPELSKR